MKDLRLKLPCCFLLLPLQMLLPAEHLASLDHLLYKQKHTLGNVHQYFLTKKKKKKKGGGNGNKGRERALLETIGFCSHSQDSSWLKRYRLLTLDLLPSDFFFLLAKDLLYTPHHGITLCIPKLMCRPFPQENNFWAERGTLLLDLAVLGWDGCELGLAWFGSRAVPGLYIFHCTIGCLKHGAVVWKYILFSRCIVITAASSPVQVVDGKRFSPRPAECGARIELCEWSQSHLNTLMRSNPDAHAQNRHL